MWEDSPCLLHRPGVELQVREELPELRGRAGGVDAERSRDLQHELDLSVDAESAAEDARGTAAAGVAMVDSAAAAVATW